MSRQLPITALRRVATDGETYTGQLPAVLECQPVVIESDPICAYDQWIELGRPLVVIRYTLGGPADITGFTFSSTYLSPAGPMTARAVTPSRCCGIELGIVAGGGEVWRPARITREGDPARAREYVRRTMGMDQPIYYWDHLLTAGAAARYLNSDGDAVRVPYFSLTTMPEGQSPVTYAHRERTVRRNADGGVVIDTPVDEDE